MSPEIFDVSYLMVTSTLAHPERGPWSLCWAHGHMGTTGSVTLSTVVRFEQTQRQIVSTVSRKHHYGIGWVVKHTGHVSFEDTCLKVSPTLPRSALYFRLWLTYFNWLWLFWLNKCSKDDHNLQEGCLEPGTCSFGGRGKGNHAISYIIKEVIL